MNVKGFYIDKQEGEIPQMWEELLSVCSWGSFYQSKDNFRIINKLIQSKLSFLSFYNIEKQLMGGLAVAVTDGQLGPVVNCLPYFGSYGDALVHPDAPPGAEGALYLFLINESRKLDALCLTVITSPFADELHHLRVREFIAPTFIDERCSQIVHMPEYNGEGNKIYADKVLTQMQGRARTAYKKIIKSELTIGSVESEAEALTFAKIHKDNIGGRGGIFKTEEFFKLIFAMSREAPEKAEMAVVHDGNAIVAGVVLFYFKDTVEYHTTCLRDEYRSLGPLTRVVVDKMIAAGMKGYRYWNFGGTWKTQEGVYRFKESFGSVDHPYYYYNLFFRDLDRVKKMTSQEIVHAYPLCYVIPFSELNS